MDSSETQRTQPGDIADRLAIVRRVFDVTRLEHERSDPAAVAAYYTHSLLGYRWLHSTAGSIHMALNPDGRFTRSGYYGQAKRIQVMTAPDTTQPSVCVCVLELGSGMGFNGLYLADAWPAARIIGIDLTPLNVRVAKLKSRTQPRVTFQQGDFHQLPFADGSFDLMFSIESVCHATDLKQVLAEAFRVLRPGAKLVVFDGYRQAGFDSLDPEIKQAARLTEAAMAVDHSWVINDWLDVATGVGFTVVDSQDLTGEILPNLQRFERIARRFFDSPLRGVFRAVLPPRLIRNAVAGLLMSATTQVGAHQYSMIVLERPG